MLERSNMVKEILGLVSELDASPAIALDAECWNTAGTRRILLRLRKAKAFKRYSETVDGWKQERAKLISQLYITGINKPHNLIVG